MPSVWAPMERRRRSDGAVVTAFLIVVIGYLVVVYGATVFDQIRNRFVEAVR